MKDNKMKYNVEPYDLNKDQLLDQDTMKHRIEIMSTTFNFVKEVEEELQAFQDACNTAYNRYYYNRKNQKAELEFHKEIKKYRKVFNHNVQDITKHHKFDVLEKLEVKPKIFMTN